MGGARREGADFASQAELAALDPGMGLRRGARRPLARDLLPLLVAEAVLSELEMMTWTGQLPGGLPWTEQVWWRVELWQAFWRARDEALGRTVIGNR